MGFIHKNLIKIKE